MLVVFEAAHWIDPSSADLLAFAAERVSRRSALPIVTSRPGFSPCWENHAHSTVLMLNRLDSNQIATLADQISRKPLPTQVREQIVGRADSVPLFAEELTKTVMGARYNRMGLGWRNLAGLAGSLQWRFAGGSLAAAQGHCRVARAGTLP